MKVKVFIYFYYETNSIINQIGNTPLIKLKQPSNYLIVISTVRQSFIILGSPLKIEALFIINQAIKNKKIKKGGIVVEGTAGNTGIGLAVVCKEYGFKLKIVIPKTQSIEKKKL